MELGSVTLKRIGFFCFPIKHSTTDDHQVGHGVRALAELDDRGRVCAPASRAQPRKASGNGACGWPSRLRVNDEITGNPPSRVEATTSLNGRCAKFARTHTMMAPKGMMQTMARLAVHQGLQIRSG